MEERYLREGERYASNRVKAVEYRLHGSDRLRALANEYEEAGDEERAMEAYRASVMVGETPQLVLLRGEALANARSASRLRGSSEDEVPVRREVYRARPPVEKSTVAEPLSIDDLVPSPTGA